MGKANLPKRLIDEAKQYAKLYREDITAEGNMTWTSLSSGRTYTSAAGQQGIFDLLQAALKDYIVEPQAYASSAMGWERIQMYKAAGTYTWIAPDLLKDGRPYEIGVWMIGGGGSGAIYHDTNTNSINGASGGASGYVKHFIQTVTPGEQYPFVIGSGGCGNTARANVDGENGNSTSAFGIVADGGGGGSSIGQGADGGQGSTTCDIIAFYLYTPVGGAGVDSNIVAKVTGEIVVLNGKSQIQSELANPFCLPQDGITPSAGGSCAPSAKIAIYQISIVLPSGNITSAGGGIDLSADKSAEPGAGGGAVYAWNNEATSAAGADGCVLIYARRLS